MFARSHDELKRVRTGVARVRRLSDRLIGIGPFGLGLDGLLGWIPGFGALYSVVAGGFLMIQGVRVRAAPSTLARMGAYLLADTLTDLIPIPVLPAAADMLFTGHKWAADALLKHLDETVYYEGTEAEAAADPAFRAHLAQLPGRQKRRVVYLRNPPLAGKAQAETAR